MSTVDLVLLGMIYEQPCSAYEMQKNIEYRNLSKWVKVSSPSIYKKVIQLEKKGYLTSDTIREGKMPEKAVYSITSAGKDYFLSLMKENATRTISVMFDFNAVVANLNKIPKEQALELLADIRTGIIGSKSYMEKMVPQRKHIPLVGQTIISQQVQVLEALLSWIDSFEHEFNGLGEGK
mgnify:CR=1 FL=1